MSFDHFQRLVRKRGGIYRDFCTHVPGWMAQGLGRCHARQLIERQRPKRATRCRQDDTLTARSRCTHETLQYRTVLAVDRYQLAATFCQSLEDERPARDQ